MSTKLDHECVIVEDGSTSFSSRKAFDELKPSRPGQVLKKIRTSNSGLADARNTALENSSGEAIRFVDADDYLTVRSTDLLIQSMNTRNSSIAIGDYFIWDENRERIDWPIRNNHAISVKEWQEISSLWEREFTIPIHSAIFKNLDLFFEPGMKSKEDWVFWSHISMDNTPSFIDYPVCGYVLHQSNMTSSRTLKSSLYWIEAFLKLRNRKMFHSSTDEKLLSSHFLRVYWDRVSAEEREDFMNKSEVDSDCENFLKELLKETHG
jgi:glycosyltransferase involved in cell wall biosynthesis